MKTSIEEKLYLTKEMADIICKDLTNMKGPGEYTYEQKVKLDSWVKEEIEYHEVRVFTENLQTEEDLLEECLMYYRNILDLCPDYLFSKRTAKLINRMKKEKTCYQKSI